MQANNFLASVLWEVLDALRQGCPFDGVGGIVRSDVERQEEADGETDAEHEPSAMSPQN